MEATKTLERRSPSPPPPIPPQSLDSDSKIEEEVESKLNVQEKEVDDDFHEIEIDQETKQEEEEQEEVKEASEPVEMGPTVLTDELRDQIVSQVEYYFSDENLSNDKFLLKHVKKDKGFVSIGLIASFRKMKRLVKDISLIVAALRTSSQLVVSKDGRSVRRLRPLPKTQIKDPKACTVIVENLHDDYSKENLEKLFANTGKLLNITIHDPNLAEESKLIKGETIYSTKLHALIEYETTEAAASAVATYNDETNWRSGMRVELLQKWMGKYGAIGKRYKESVSEKSSHNQASDMASDGDMSKSDNHHNEKSEKENEDHFADGKGKRRSRYRTRGRGQHNTSGLGHGQAHSSSCNGVVSKPPPGPKMPDGTRGFTVGRGKSSDSPPN